jgi:tRNA(Arg) A34 adenosine deaminase TadA
MNNGDLSILQKAITLCEANPPDSGQQRVSAVITDSKGNILATGINSYEKTHPFQAKYAERVDQNHAVYLHAEIAALVKIRRGDPKKIYVARLLRNGEYALARPCAICAMAIKESGITEIIFTDSNTIHKEIL